MNAENYNACFTFIRTEENQLLVLHDMITASKPGNCFLSYVNTNFICLLYCKQVSYPCLLHLTAMFLTTFAFTSRAGSKNK